MGDESATSVDVRQVGGDETIWRYMSFAKFASMLATKTLRFTRLDQFDDPFEGAFPAADLPILRASMPKGDADYDAFAFFDEDEDEYYRLGTRAEQRKVRTWSDAAKQWRSVTYANCWHENEHESAAMWDVYAASGEGIAIRSTPSRLLNSVRTNPWRVDLAFVAYFDYERHSFATADGMLDLSCAEQTQ